MAPDSPEPTYTVFVRLPFPRGDFVDPPPANWDSSKDEALWSIISNLSKTEIDWNQMHFQVTVDFLLQQVAWLTERHASQVRAQMRKAAAAAKISPTPSPQPPSSDGQVLNDNSRLPVPGPNSHSRVPSATFVRRASPLPRTETGTPATSMRSTPRPLPTRTHSTNSQTLQARPLSGGSKAAGQAPVETQSRRLTSLPVTTAVDDYDDHDDQDDRDDQDYGQDYRRTAPPSPGPAEYSSPASSASSSSSSPAQSRIIRRPPRFQNDDDDEEEEEAEPAFLPYGTHAASSTTGHHDLSATLRGNLRDSGKRPGQDRILHSQTSDSSTSSAPVSRVGTDARSSGILSPRRTMDSAVQSPGSKSKGYSRGGSISSSFSDLDDASVTQSALEEALASKMQDNGTIASLRGTITNAFRSRYQS
ncbi:hypothetical protein F5Y17DRAFT_457213 [Xylariaceae sp. FL0594]|nr:hypothetical protein F5Y17DRAFT_457213 [Xylariaceae sp. FL0594]